jgi:hypothetical protein
MPPECYSNEYASGYCDAYGCPDDYYDLPIWYGPVFYGDAWYNGPVYYRDGFGGRQYWIHGGWHSDQWRGPRPSWWTASRYHTGSALGRSWYRSHGSAHQRGNWNRGSEYRDTFRGSRDGSFGGLHNDRHSGAGRDAFSGSRSWQHSIPHTQSAVRQGGHNWSGRDFSGSHASHGNTGSSFRGAPHRSFGNNSGGRSFGGSRNFGGGHSFSGGGSHGGGGGWHGGGGGGHGHR